MAVFYAVDNVAFFYCLQAVGNDNQCLAPMQMVDGIHNSGFRVIIQCGSGFIQHQYLR